MRFKAIIICVFAAAISIGSSGQSIRVDSSSTSKYIIKRPVEPDQPAVEEELTFSDRAISIGKGILNRLKSRLNLEEAAESLKAKKDQYLGKREEEVVEEKKEAEDN